MNKENIIKGTLVVSLFVNSFRIAKYYNAKVHIRELKLVRENIEIQKYFC